MRSRTALKTREKGTGSIYKLKNRFYLKHRINGKSKAMMLRNLEGSRGMRRVLLIKTMEETAHYAQEAKLLGKTAERMSGFVTRYARIPDTAHDEIPALKR